MEIPECHLDLSFFLSVFSCPLYSVVQLIFERYGNIFPSLAVSDMGYCWATAGTPDRRLQYYILLLNDHYPL